MSRFQFRGCPRCGGDLYLNQGDWQCLHCGRYPRPAAASAMATPLPPPGAGASANADADAGGFWDFWRRRAAV